MNCGPYRVIVILEGQSVVSLAVLEFKAERFVEVDGWHVFFPDVQVNGFNVAFVARVGDDMLH